MNKQLVSTNICQSIDCSFLVFHPFFKCCTIYVRASWLSGYWSSHLDGQAISFCDCSQRQRAQKDLQGLHWWPLLVYRTFINRFLQATIEVVLPQHLLSFLVPTYWCPCISERLWKIGYQLLPSYLGRTIELTRRLTNVWKDFFLQKTTVLDVYQNLCRIL